MGASVDGDVVCCVKNMNEGCQMTSLKPKVERSDSIQNHLLLNQM